VSEHRVRRYTAASLDVPDRQFQITQATRTHTKLWLQANAVPHLGHPYRLDVVFHDVQYLSFPFVMRGLALRRADPEETTRLSALHGLQPDPRTPVTLLSKDHDWFIVAGTVLWAEADLEYNDPSVFWSSTGDDNPKLISVGTLQ
jgi:hypothetical protein